MNVMKNYTIYDEDGCLMFYELTPAEWEEFQYHSPSGHYLHRTYSYLLDATYTIDKGVLTIKGNLHFDKVLGVPDGWGVKSFRLKKDDPLIKAMQDEYYMGDEALKPFKRTRFNWSKLKKEEYIDETMVYIRRSRFVKRKGSPKTYTTSNFRIKHYEKEEKTV